jgi:hypothetical protein
MENTQDNNLKAFDSQFNNRIMQARKTLFGKIMTIVDTLGLPEKQTCAIKSLVAQDIDFVMRDILDRELEEDLHTFFPAYERCFAGVPDSILK